MGFADIHGRARVDARAPEGFGRCDDCGEWYNLGDLIWQLEYFGPSLKRTGFRVCRRCNDEPQPQFKPIILPGDPKPLVQPRVEEFILDDAQLGFSVYFLQPTSNPPSSESAILANVAVLSGIQMPPGLVDQSGSIVLSNTAQQLVPPNSSRSYLLIYSANQAPLAVSFGVAAFGAQGTLMLGPGQALLWATSEGQPPVSMGAMTICGYFPGQTFNAWET